MFSRLVSFALGIYAGIYLDQYYSLPKIVGPMDLYDKIKDEMEKHRKNNPGPSKDDS